MSEKYTGKIAPAKGKLGVLCVGLGAVTTTFMAGVENVRQGRAKAFGSLTQLATIRLGKRTDGRSPLIQDFVPLANLEDLVFGAWDPIPDNAYEAALKAGVLDKHEHIEPIAAFLKAHRADAARSSTSTTSSGSPAPTSSRGRPSGSWPTRSARTCASSRRSTDATGWSSSGARRPRSSFSPARRTRPSPRSRRRWRPTTRPSRRRCSTPMPRSWRGCRSPTARRT